MITLPRAQLAAELALLNTIAGGRATIIPAASTVKLDFDGTMLTLMATDIDVTVVTRVEGSGEQWAGCVPCSQLTTLVKLFDVETVTLKPVEQRLELQAGRARHKLPVTSVGEFPQVQMVEGETLMLSLPQLLSAISATSFAMMDPSDGMRVSEQRFTGLSLHVADGTLECMATQKVVTAVAEVAAEGVLSTVLPRQAVAVLQRLEGETVAVTATEGQVQFIAGQRTIIARPLMGEFPKWRDFLPPAQHTVRLQSDELRDAIRRASVTMGIDNAVGFEPMKATWVADSVTVVTRGGERGHSLEQVAIASNLNGQPLAIGFVGQQVLSVLAKCEGEVTIDLADSKSPMVFRDGRATTFIVMPIGLKW